jgi:hypothetical protein
VWLLEELNLEYELKIFERNAEFRAGDDLKQVHPLGRSPMIGITPAGADKEILIFESATIVDYVCDHFGRHMIPQRYPEGKEGVLGAENENFMRYRVSLVFFVVCSRDRLHLLEPRCISNGGVIIGCTSSSYDPGVIRSSTMSLSQSSLYTINHALRVRELTKHSFSWTTQREV